VRPGLSKLHRGGRDGIIGVPLFAELYEPTDRIGFFHRVNVAPLSILDELDLERFIVFSVHLEGREWSAAHKAATREGALLPQ
jgi:hypothetical protein